MARFILTIDAKGLSETSVQKLVRDHIRKTDVTVTVTKVKEGSSRSDRLSAAMADVETAASEVESLKDELQEWHDNMPENLQDGDKGSQLDDAVQALEELYDKLNEAVSDSQSIDFPGMY